MGFVNLGQGFRKFGGNLCRQPIKESNHQMLVFINFCLIGLILGFLLCGYFVYGDFGVLILFLLI